MLFKLLFTLLTVLWLSYVLRPHLGTVRSGDQRKKTPTAPPGPNIQKRADDNGGEYIDYEEVKE